jgi:hypothetical protein
MVVQFYSSSTWEDKARGSQVQDQAGLHIKTLFQKKRERERDECIYAHPERHVRHIAKTKKHIIEELCDMSRMIRFCEIW